MFLPVGDIVEMCDSKRDGRSAKLGVFDQTGFFTKYEIKLPGMENAQRSAPRVGVISTWRRTTVSSSKYIFWTATEISFPAAKMMPTGVTIMTPRRIAIRELRARCAKGEK